ncbi:peptidoglycan-binding domain-containing protein [Diaminobutyricibacter sp. McL0608]|uniref:peptidoglycan-binding domain-containing protein n=1 Tax=Leifsonia sp. McL0608 TaxID=3143537 RepID=UPI0031F308A0
MMNRKRIGRSQFGLGALALAGAAALGAVAVSLAPLLLPKSLQTVPTAQEIPISAHAFYDERPVEITVSRSSSATVTTPASGLITRYDCEVGAGIASGSSFFAVDEGPVLALATEVPLWRDLAIGDTGADVRSLQAELNRLGYNLTVDGTVGRATLRAAFQSLTAVGIEWEGPTFPVSRTVWLPTPKVSVRSCDTALGARVADGDPIATFSFGQQSIAVDELPNDLVTGPRVVTIGATTVPVDAAGKSGPISLDLAPQAQDPTSTEESSTVKPIAATLSLAEPTEVSSVPPSTIVDLDRSHGCVESNGDMIPVHVVGSQLGQTFVQFHKGKAPQKIRLHPSHRPCP